MIFQAMNRDGRLVKVYDLSAQYEIDDENRRAYIVQNGQSVEVPYMSALEQIAGHKEHDSRTYSYNVTVTEKQVSMWIGIALVTVTFVAGLWAHFAGWFL